MFSVLREISQSDAFRSFIQGYLGDSNYLERQTHGIRLAVDEYWSDWWHLSNYLAPLYPIPTQGIDLSRWRALLSAMGYTPPSRHSFLATPPPNWSAYCTARNWPQGSLPFRIIFSLRPGTYLGELDGVRRRSWQSNGTHPIEFEVRPLVRGHCQHKAVTPLVGGVSLGPGGGNRVESGTLGGIAHYGSQPVAFTCAHVFGEQADASGEIWHPAASDDGNAKRIGQLRTIHHPTPRIGEFCNRTATYASTSDVAVIEIDSHVDSNLSVRQLGLVSSCRPIDRIGSYEATVFVGKESDRREVRTEQLSHFQEVMIHGKVYCYQDMFTIGFRNHQYLTQNLSTPGDSGSWLLSDPGLSTRDLLGMLVAGDGEKSFCCFAENFVTSSGFNMSDLVFR